MTEFFGIDVLTFLIISPAIGAAIVAALAYLPSKWVGRYVALGIAILIGLISGIVFFQYVGSDAAAAGEFALEQKYRWFTALGASWHVGIDGISAAMMLLTGILTPLAILISWEVDDRSNMHLALLLLFETGAMACSWRWT